MSPKRARPSESLVLDADVLRPGPVCEFGAAVAVEAQGGVSVQPWRDRFLAAEQAGLSVLSDAGALGEASFDQAVVHLQKSRAASWDDLAEAWRVLRPGGELLFSGSNTLGISSAVKRLEEELVQDGIVVANRARARVVRFRKQGEHAPRRDAAPPIEVVVPGGDEPRALALETLASVARAKPLDAGSELLLAVLASWQRAGEKAPKRVVDLHCGDGRLGLAAAALHPAAEVVLVDADARAVACAAHNAERLGFTARCRTLWWDVREEPPARDFDLALLRPPLHDRSPEFDLAPALALVASLERWLARSGRVLVVASRTLPFEAPLRRLGELEVEADARGYKVLSVSRRSRSSGASGRRAPGSRSFGSSRPPMRSR